MERRLRKQIRKCLHYKDRRSSVYAYQSYWLLRRHPLQIVDNPDNNETIVFVNEKFVFSRLAKLNCLAKISLTDKNYIVPALISFSGDAFTADRCCWVTFCWLSVSDALGGCSFCVRICLCSGQHTADKKFLEK